MRKTVLVSLFVVVGALLVGCGDSSGAKPDSSGAASAKPSSAPAATGSAKSGGGW